MLEIRSPAAFCVKRQPPKLCRASGWMQREALIDTSREARRPSSFIVLNLHPRVCAFGFHSLLGGEGQISSLLVES